MDLSAAGIRFRAVACEIALGERLRLTFLFLGQTVTATGTVAWSTEIDALTLEVGIEFEAIEARDRALLEAFSEGREVGGSP